MICAAVEKHYIRYDVLTTGNESSTGRITKFGLVMSLLLLLFVFYHSTIVRSCYDYVTKNKKDIIHIECLPKVIFYEPWDVPTLNVSFKLHDKHNRHRVQQLRWDESFPMDDFYLTADDKLVVIIHGYTENADESWIHKLITAYFGRPDSDVVKIISVDWEKAALGQTWFVSRNFVQAASNARMVGRVVGAFLGRLMQAYNVHEESLHVLGHSLGAHAMGEAIRVLHEDFRIKAGRATAFDAASPLFEWRDILPNRQHTHFLEALHTSSAISLLGLLWGEVGVYKAYGHVDLYPNAGSLYQPACRGSNFFFCSHRRGYIYYTEMLSRCVEPCDFEGLECKSEFEAVSSSCSGRKIDVWKQMQSRNNKSSIVYFTTDVDRLKLTCKNRLF